MITAKDIQIFIATFNRPKLVIEALESIKKQTAKGFEVFILDNSNDGATADKKTIFEAAGAKYIQTPQNVLLANFSAAQQLSDKKYCMIFHDDDLLHPQYIETALAWLNKYPDITLLSGGCTNFRAEAPSFANPLSRKAFIYHSGVDFAAHVFSKNMFNYPCCLYKTELFKTAPNLFNIYHKNNDLPFVLSIARQGTAVIINDVNCVHTRQHEQQDSKDSQNGTELKNLYAWVELFYGQLSTAGKQGKLYKAWCVDAYNNIKNAYGYLKKSEKDKMSFTELLADLKQKGFVDEDIINIGRYRESVFLRLSSAPRRFLWRWRAPKAEDL
jgi:glycosyltransferase involved in cell wall biosynthesis